MVCSTGRDIVNFEMRKKIGQRLSTVAKKSMSTVFERGLT